MNGINEQLVRAVAAKIREVAPAGGWDQEHFACVQDNACGTAHCFAGWTLRLSGWGYVPDDRDTYGMWWVLGTWRSPEGETIRNGADVGVKAQKLLGIGFRQGVSIFYNIAGGSPEGVEEFLARVGRELKMEGL